MDDDAAARLRENAMEITTMAVTGLWLALLFLPVGTGLWLPVMLVGYLVVIPIVALLYGDDADRAEWWDDWSGSSADEREREEPATAGAEPAANSESAGASTPGDALETLRERYAAGELTDEQFERKLERLLETETLEDAEQWHRQRGAANDGGREADTGPVVDLSRDTETERERR
ncbi:SHOCT domain-containing protein [Natronolimnohabitans innermongolicus]|uniref:SHOCT domain-containing protein n=1 Tax=Natronolimnohabitans innermongolicus JCM 12255 TaxID=1227499 RepID=L9WUM6_9EURY|nr:SHOCT domain-containing protein [Natronolimnohabitans innermongolicus]ELY52018.1 hypothetical protein C493_16696 [Natronolimnohabitans innermongolicus JCM 12255]